MDITNAALLLGLFFLGSYIQTVTGFAFGLIVMGLSSVMGLADLAFLAFATSTLSLANTGIALRGHAHHVYRPAVVSMLCTAIPLTGLGLWLLDRFSQDDISLLKWLLGITLVLSCLLMMLKPKPRTTINGRLAFASAGAIAGLLGGLFATYGPPLAFLMYRQPLPLLSIRLTLLMTFAATSIIRIALALPFLNNLHSVFLICALGLPLVIAGTVIGKRLGPPLPEIWMRRLAFALLMGSGLSLMASGLMT
jgi:uncharacterized membrane protein YfcA